LVFAEIGLQPRRPGSIAVMGTGLRRCDEIFAVSVDPPIRHRPVNPLNESQR
jgi:hypothetical protein